MSRHWKHYQAAHKSTVGLEAIEGVRTVNEIVNTLYGASDVPKHPESRKGKERRNKK